MVAGSLGLWLATELIGAVEFTGDIKYLMLAGCVLGLINFFIKPVLKLITLPLQLLTFGIFGVIINMAMIWIVDIFFEELIIPGTINLFWTTLIVWLTSVILGFYSPKRRN